MTLRPVSELGLVDVTDLASREADKTKSSGRSHNAAATKARRAAPSSGRSTGSNSTSKTASSPTAKATIGEKSAISRPTRASASASTPKRRKAAGTGSRGSVPAARQRKRTGDSRGIQSASQNGQSHRESKALAANLGIGAVTGAIGVAGGVLIVRTARQRPRRILGVSLSA